MLRVVANDKGMSRRPGQGAWRRVVASDNGASRQPGCRDALVSGGELMTVRMVLTARTITKVMTTMLMTMMRMMLRWAQH